MSEIKTGMSLLDILRDALSETLYWPRTFREITPLERVQVDGIIRAKGVHPEQFPEYRGLHTLESTDAD